MVLEGDQNGVINSARLEFCFGRLDAVLEYPDGGGRLGVRNSPIDDTVLL